MLRKCKDLEVQIVRMEKELARSQTTIEKLKGKIQELENSQSLTTDEDVAEAIRRAIIKNAGQLKSPVSTSVFFNAGEQSFRSLTAPELALMITCYMAFRASSLSSDPVQVKIEGEKIVECLKALEKS